MLSVGILIVVWVSSAAYTTNIYASIAPLCKTSFSPVVTLCTELQTVVALSHLNWAFCTLHLIIFLFIANDATLVFLYVIRLIVLSSKSRHGQDVWQMSVKEADFGMEQLDTFGVNREFKNSSAV